MTKLTWFMDWSSLNVLKTQRLFMNKCCNKKKIPISVMLPNEID